MHVVTPTITVNASAYESGDAIGGKITLSDVMDVSGGSAILDSILMTDEDNQKPVGKWYIFQSDPSGSTLTDDIAAAIAVADLSKLLGVVDVASGDWHSTDTKGFAVKVNLNLGMKASGSKHLYAAYVTTGTPTFTGTTKFKARFTFRRGLTSK